MEIKLTGKIAQFKCDQQAFQDFPDILFGQDENGNLFFDTFNTITAKGARPEEFFKEYHGPIQALLDTGCVAPDEPCVVNAEGHVLLASSLFYLYASWLRPDFLAYINDRVDELFSNGFAVSDHYLLNAARERIPQSLLAAPGEETDIQV